MRAAAQQAVEVTLPLTLTLTQALTRARARARARALPRDRALATPNLNPNQARGALHWDQHGRRARGRALQRLLHSWRHVARAI